MTKPPTTSFLNQARLFVNKILSLAGFEIVRRPRKSSFGVVSVQIGKYPISMQENNLLWVQYYNNPDYTAQLGRLATHIFQTYPDGMAIDVGANIGDTAAIVRSAVNVPIICIEGDAAVMPLLQKNIAQMANVTAYQYFLGQKTENVEVVIQKDGWDSTIVPVKSGEHANSKTMSLVTLDEVLAKIGLPKPCKLLKVDVEGFDLKVLRGASSLLQRDRPVILFEWNHQNLEQIGEPSQSIFTFLAALQYDVVLVFDGQGELVLPAKVTDSNFLQDLYDYSRTVEGVFYYDICAFPIQDLATAQRFLSAERARRQKRFDSNVKVN